MHAHTDLPVRVFLVSLMDDTLPDPRVHMIKVESGCVCDMWDFVVSIPDLPFAPAFMVVREDIKVSTPE